MSTGDLKSIDKLRELATGSHSYISNGRVLEFVNEIEQEIAERYMELPLDADGVPIRPDDLMACTAFDTNDFDGKEHVLAVGNGFWVDKDGRTHIPSEMRHVKPRTIEDVLEEFLIEFDDWDWNTDGNDRDNARKQLFAKYAAEIREVLEVKE